MKKEKTAAAAKAFESHQAYITPQHITVAEVSCANEAVLENPSSLQLRD